LSIKFLACPAGWTQDQFGEGSNLLNCYKISEDKKSWGAAECECAKTGGHLAYLADANANSYYQHLVSLIKSNLSKKFLERPGFLYEIWPPKLFFKTSFISF